MSFSFFVLYFIVFFLNQTSVCTENIGKEACKSPVYCYGELLHTVQTAGIFNDSKTFVDMSMRHPLNETLENFDIFMRQTDHTPTTEQIKTFVFENFQTVGEMEDFFPRDFKPEPKFVKEIEDKKVREFLKKLIAIWPELTRKISQRVFERPEMFSIIPIKNAFIVPGGRFKEYYYWDSYWVIKGLLLSGMFETAKGMIDNFIHIVGTYGFIPNGGRIYYLNRSQPPVLTLLMKDYVKYTKDYVFLKENILTLEKELRWWLNKRVVRLDKDGATYHLAHFDSDSDTPRPESYLEDLETCAVHETTELEHECFTDIKAACESGIDFSSRWIFNEKDEPNDDISQIQTRRIIPVDLNSFLYKSFRFMHHFYVVFREPTNAKYWQDLADKWQDAIEKVLYHEDDGIWYDYDRKNEKHRRHFYASNFAPLWADAVSDDDKIAKGNRAVKYLVKHGGLTFYGIPSALYPSGLQWDFPNAWAPHQNIIIFGLERSGDEEAQKLAKALAYRWVESNLKAFDENKVVFEKLSAVQSGQFGGGGEYHIQSGFGWTNGGIMEIIDYYFRTKNRRYIVMQEESLWKRR